MLNRAPAPMQRFLGRVAPFAMYGARLYLAVAIIQFVAGFIVGGSLALFDYDVEFINVLLPVGG